MPFAKRIAFLVLITCASFVLLHAAVFLVHGVYRQPSWDALCQEGVTSICKIENRQILQNIDDAYQWNIKGSFYLAAAFALMLVPIFRKRHELFAPMLYGFSLSSVIFAFFATQGMWFFQIGSNKPDAISSLLLSGICMGVSYLIYRQGERMVAALGLTCPIPERESLLSKVRTS